MRRWSVVVVVVVAALVPVVPGSLARASETAAERAAREIADAQDRAAEANAAYMEAQWKLEELQHESDANAARVAELESQVGALQGRVQQVALNRFTGSSEEVSPILTGLSSEDQMQLSAFTQVIWDTADTAFDDYESLRRDLVAEQRTLEYVRQQTLQQQEALAGLRDRALAEAETLKRVEAQRLKDEATRKALEAEQARRSAAAVSSASSRVTNAGLSGRSGPTRSGNWGGVGWVCPTGDARVGFGDTWGAPRSGGRSHQGTDMIGALGTPLLAVVDGRAQARSNTLGGLVVFFYGDDGVFYYYAHLDSYGQLGQVAKGTVIGYMGTTGNAGTPHLHFEIHPNGVGSPVNPYSTLRAAC